MPWLFEEEPSHYSFDALVRDGKTVWAGVTNALAQQHLRRVAKGDRIFHYHTGREKAVVGIARAASAGARGAAGVLMSRGRSVAVAFVLVAVTSLAVAQTRPGLQIADLSALRAVGDVQLSRDGTWIAYAVIHSDRPGRPYSRIAIRNVATGATTTLGDGSTSPRFSPDGTTLAFIGRQGNDTGLFVAGANGAAPRWIAPAGGTNHPLPSSGERVAWSPDGKQIAFISSVPGPEADANGDPMHITRYLYKPTASEGSTRFNDNRRLHIFVADVATHQVRQLTSGAYYEHSIDWSPTSREILFVSNRAEPDPDRFFNYDVFAVDAATGATRRVTDTPSAEYAPKWSPDGAAIAFAGTTRPLTSSETTMEDTHVWVMKADGSDRREIGGATDNRQGSPEWSPNGRSVYFTVQERGSTRPPRLPVSGGAPEFVVRDTGQVGAWSVASVAGAHAAGTDADDIVAYALATPASPGELFVKTGAAAPRAVTTLNAALLAERELAPVESLLFRASDGLEVEAFLTRPLRLDPAKTYPLIATIHGGPHGQQGPAFNGKAQIYAAEGFASLMVNYRGSTGYGQAHADAIFQDQNGGEARDVLEGLDAALAKHAWLDAARQGVEGGSYGGQLADWLITRTDRFKAAIPGWGISNLVSFNYMSYYHDYLAVEFGGFPHEPFRPTNTRAWPEGRTHPATIVDVLWERSAIRYVNRVKTPALFLHGENDNDVPIGESEQFYIALRDVGVPAEMVRYPREGHGIRETRHVQDLVTRSLAWYGRFFSAGS